jgi:hypothetical protein
MFDTIRGEMQGVPLLEGTPGRQETIGLYESFRGRKVQDLTYYELLAWLQMCILITRRTAPAVTDDPAIVNMSPFCRYLCAVLKEYDDRTDSGEQESSSR